MHTQLFLKLGPSHCKPCLLLHAFSICLSMTGDRQKGSGSPDLCPFQRQRTEAPGQAKVGGTQKRNPAQGWHHHHQSLVKKVPYKLAYSLI